MPFDRRQYRVGGLAVEEEYDCIVVGAGISGLAAAHYYRERFGTNTRVLVLDNHDEFGGHARRNEFRVGDRLLIGYGGSEALQSPEANFSPTVNALMRALGVETARFRTLFDQDLYPGLGLSRGSFFDRDRFGTDRLVTGDPTDWVSDDIPRDRRNGRPIEAFIGDFPMTPASRRQLLELYSSKRVDLARLPDDAAREDYLSKISYSEFLRRDWGLSEEAIAYFDGRTLDFFGLPPDLLPALDCGLFAYPGFAGIALPESEEAAAELAEPYVYHFPDGNASIARLLVRKLVPAAMPGQGMDDIVLAEARYDALDRPRNPVRIRLESTVVRVVNGEGYVDVGVIANRDRSLHRLRARHVVLACFNMLVPYALGGVPTEQAAALRQNVKMPLVYTNVLVRDWRPWQRLGVHEIYGVSSFHSRVKLDYPVSIGGYRCSTGSGGANRAAHGSRADRPRNRRIRALPCARHEGCCSRARSASTKPRYARISRACLAREASMRSATSLRSPSIAGRTATPGAPNTLVDDWEAHEAIIESARRPVGRVTIANSDSAWSAYAHVAIDEAHRAVSELPAG